MNHTPITATKRSNQLDVDRATDLDTALLELRRARTPDELERASRRLGELTGGAYETANRSNTSPAENERAGRWRA